MTASVAEVRPGVVQLSALIATLVIAAVVGVWSYLLPQAFYDHFPAVLGEWISQDGPYNEHLVRDHGAMYLALGLASAGGLIWRSQPVYRVLGTAWTTFGVLHFIYHVTHLGHMSVSDATAQVIVLVVAGLLGVALFIAPRDRRHREVRS